MSVSLRCGGDRMLSVVSRAVIGSLAARQELLYSGNSRSSPCFESDMKGQQMTAFGWIFDPIAVSILTSTLLPTTEGREGKTM